MPQFKATITLYNAAIDRHVEAPLQLRLGEMSTSNTIVFECPSYKEFMQLVTDNLPNLSNLGVEIVKVNTERVA